MKNVSILLAANLLLLACSRVPVMLEIDAMAIHGGLEERIERKPGCLALHWRGLEQGEILRLRSIVEESWGEVAASNGLMVTEFNGGMEVRAPDRHKGDVVRMVLGEEPQGTVAAYLGDDRTDEDAFEAIKDRGLGILVADRSRPSGASLRLSPPEEVLAFLKRWTKVRNKKDVQG